MTKPTEFIKRTLIGTMVFLQVFFFPLRALAQTAPATDADSTTTSKQTEQAAAGDKPPGTTSTVNTTATTEKQPGDSEQVPPKYTQNADGTWSNGTYTWNPDTKQSAPNTNQDYSYNPETTMWDTKDYRYDPATGKYVPNVTSNKAQNPGSNISAALTSAPSNQAVSLGGTSATGPNSTNSIGLGSNTDLFFGGFYNASISTTVNSNARSGDALVVQNTIGGNALSGDAKVIANLLNMLQSSWDPNSSQLATFVASINGDVNGDIMIDPSLIGTGPGSLNVANGESNNNLKVVAQENGQINNDVNLNAASGNSTVSGNTQGGNAVSGNASAVANILNLINSYISSGNSFFGVLNINGNLNGDILLAPWLLQGLIANSGPNSSNTTSQTTNNNLNASVSDNKTINNNVTANANTGAANVSGNTSAGNGSSGDASTNITILNLTGREVIAKNALLVFVNVFGKWVGLIMDTPAGTNSALLTTTGPGSTNSGTTTQNNNVDIDLASNKTINNNVNVAAASGDANVTGNTIGGNATTGDAHAGVNIGNIINSKFNISDWFGVLFINVFGNWLGSFGVDTAAGNPSTANTTAATSNSSAAITGSGSTVSGAEQTPRRGLLSFLPHSFDRSSETSTLNGSTDQNIPTTDEEVLRAIDDPGAFTTQSGGTNFPGSALSGRSNWWVIAIGTLSGLLLLGGERISSLKVRKPKNL